MNVPNALTFARFFLIPLYLYIFLAGDIAWAFLVLLFAGGTDVLDGYLARRNKQTTALGSMLDPLADKSMMLTVVLSFLYVGMIDWSAAIAMFIRDGGMIIGSAIFHFRGKKMVSANTMGKLTTVLYYLAIPLIMFEVRYAVFYLWIVIVFSFVTSFIYILKIKQLNKK
ncbi:MAG: CDP-alcohol phosphatidyltransferase family protein [Paenibacillaceae bacterium]